MHNMRRGRFTSRWLQQYIRDHGGVMNVTNRTVIVG
jgi:hypothetical protein